MFNVHGGLVKWYFVHRAEFGMEYVLNSLCRHLVLWLRILVYIVGTDLNAKIDLSGILRLFITVQKYKKEENTLKNAIQVSVKVGYCVMLCCPYGTSLLSYDIHNHN